MAVACGFVLAFSGVLIEVLLFGSGKDLRQALLLLLKVRWPGLKLLTVSDADEGLEMIRGRELDIVMLEFDPPSLACFDLLGDIRSFSSVPVIALSTSNDVIDKVRALEMGADDWITRSCMPMEFIARVSAILRRCSVASSMPCASFRNGEMSIDYATRAVSVSGRSVKLTPIEYRILCQLAGNQGRVVDHRMLLHSVWGSAYDANPEFLKKYIHRLRSKIEDDPSSPRRIVNERGVGYLLVKSSDSTQ